MNSSTAQVRALVVVAMRQHVSSVTRDVCEAETTAGNRRRWGKAIARLPFGGLVPAIGLLALAGCSALSPPEPSVEIAVPDAVAAFDPSYEVVDVTLALRIQNLGTRSVWYHPCGTGLERFTVQGTQAVDGKQSVWYTLCVLLEGGEVEIAAGQDYQTAVHVWARLGQGAADRWSEPVDGTYDLVVALRDQQGNLPASWRTSNRFRIQLR